MEFYGYHGVLPEENKLGQRFRVSIVLGLDLKRAGETDRLEETVSYADVYACVKKLLKGSLSSSLKLLQKNWLLPFSLYMKKLRKSQSK